VDKLWSPGKVFQGAGGTICSATKVTISSHCKRRSGGAPKASRVSRIQGIEKKYKETKRNKGARQRGTEEEGERGVKVILTSKKLPNFKQLSKSGSSRKETKYRKTSTKQGNNNKQKLIKLLKNTEWVIMAQRRIAVRNRQKEIDYFLNSFFSFAIQLFNLFGRRGQICDKKRVIQ